MITREELAALLAGNVNDLISKVEDHKKVVKIGKKEYTVEDILKQYDPLQHDVTDLTKRPDKIVTSDTGEEYTDSLDGTIKNKQEAHNVSVNRLPLSVQQKIVLIGAAFLVGERILLESDTASEIEKSLLKLLKKIWLDNKLDYKSMELAEKQMSETHCAELWYDYEDADYWEDTINKGSFRRPGMMILSESNGDKLYAIKDQYNDLVAFGRGYTVTNDTGIEIEHFDLYTDATIIYATKIDDRWQGTPKANSYRAIPVIYYDQDRAEWSNVQPLIERKEEKLSNFADTNDYFDSPALVAEGEVDSLPDKGEVGKMFKVETDSNGRGGLKYLTWDQAPQSTKMEFEILDKEIHSLSHTPDISFEAMKGVLGNVSGIALKLLFMDPQLKAVKKQQKFGELIQRRINFLKKMLISFNPVILKGGVGLNVSPRFKSFMPVNEVEYNTLLLSAYQGGMISQMTMLELSTLVKDPAKEIKEINLQDSINTD